MVLEMIIRSNLKSQDVKINGNNSAEFEKNLFSFLHQVSDNTSQYYLGDDYIFNKLINCTKRVFKKSQDECPLIFDSWSCFNATPSGTFQTEPCPEFQMMKFSSSRLALKYCDTDGGWWVHPATNRTWSNYTDCVDFQKLDFHTTLNSVYFTGLFVSLFCLSLSLLIFFSYHCLNSDRVTIHKNLFSSFWLSSFSWICWIYFVLYDLEVWSNNGTLCRVIHVITTYTTLTNYSWMLCEGILLQLLLSDLNLNERTLSCLNFIGWIVPALIIIPYAIHRLRHENKNCWMDTGNSNWILGVPVILVILINIIILVNVLIILRSKLRCTETSPRSERSKENTLKQARAILFLAPILGLNFLPFPFRPEEGSQLEAGYDVMMAIFSGFQGTFVSFVLCFSNSEVINVIERRWNQYFIVLFEVFHVLKNYMM